MKLTLAVEVAIIKENYKGLWGEQMNGELNFVICDDEHSFIDTIENELNNLMRGSKRNYKITSFDKGSDLVNYFNTHSADAIFLDIDMPDMTGFEATQKLQQIKQDILIVFITSHEDKVYQSWEYQPFWFVRKSRLSDLNIVLPKLLVRIDTEREKEQNTVRLITENKVVLLDINSVQYLQSYNHYIMVKDRDNKTTQIRCKMADAEKQLYPFYFVRVQNSAIVNCRFISKITSRSVILHSGEEISVSRPKAEYVKNEFQKFIRSR